MILRVASPANVSPVTPSDVRRMLLERMGLRVGDEVAAYVVRRLGGAGAGMISVIASDARTGVPLQVEVDPGLLQSSATAS